MLQIAPSSWNYFSHTIIESLTYPSAASSEDDHTSYFQRSGWRSQEEEDRNMKKRKV